MSQHESEAHKAVEFEELKAGKLWTVPNLICIGRLVGSLILVGVASGGYRYWFVGVYLVLIFSDWIDGKYARWMNQRTALGARLDTFADLLLNSCLIVGASILCWAAISEEWPFLIAAIGSYFLTCLTGLIKFGRIPAYHTYLAKFSQFLVMIAALCLVLDWTVWPLRVAAIFVTIGNLETLTITFMLSEWKADVLSLFYVWPKSNAEGEKD